MSAENADLPPITAADIFSLLAERYKGKPDDFKLSIGHYETPLPEQSLTIFNLPEFAGYISLTMREVRTINQQLNGVEAALFTPPLRTR